LRTLIFTSTSATRKAARNRGCARFLINPAAVSPGPLHQAAGTPAP
jgi:hypothetical protein